MADGSLNLFDLSGSVVAVIGATGTLGGAIAQGLAAHGATIAVLGRNAERGGERVKAIEAAGGAARFVQADALDRSSLEGAREEIERELGPCDVLVSAAGGNDARASVTDQQSFEELPLDAWRANFDMNLVAGALLPAQAFGPAMVERGQGSIINIASVAAHIPVSRGVAYSAAKAALLNLSTFLSREWATKGVRVNTITPGFFPADQNRALLFDEKGEPTARARQILGATPMNRFGASEELVGAAVFLASHRASGFVTGTDVRVDGGFLSATI
ncbi:MAG: D-mannonate oxidoreductase [Phycisphaerae bacterium]|nr:D-mannonate oxidoreductase [Phycisphaerae bacterium]